MAKKKLTGRGGPGRGQGRKPKYSTPTTLVAATVPEDVAAALDKAAAKRGLNRSEAVTKAIELWLTREPSA